MSTNTRLYPVVAFGLIIFATTCAAQTDIERSTTQRVVDSTGGSEEWVISGQDSRWYSLIRQGWIGGTEDDIPVVRDVLIRLEKDKMYQALSKRMKGGGAYFWYWTDSKDGYVAEIDSFMVSLFGLDLADDEIRGGFWNGTTSGLIRQYPEGTETKFVREEFLTTAGKRAYRGYFESREPKGKLYYEVQHLIELSGGILHRFKLRVISPDKLGRPTGRRRERALREFAERYNSRLAEFDSMLERLTYKY